MGLTPLRRNGRDFWSRQGEGEWSKSTYYLGALVFPRERPTRMCSSGFTTFPPNATAHKLQRVETCGYPCGPVTHRTQGVPGSLWEWKGGPVEWELQATGKGERREKLLQSYGNLVYTKKGPPVGVESYQWVWRRGHSRKGSQIFWWEG